MKTYNWFPGICLSLGVSVIASFPRMLKTGDFGWEATLGMILYMEAFSLLCWFLHSWLMNNRQLELRFPNRWSYAAACVTSVALIALLYNYLFAPLAIKGIPLEGISPERKLALVLLRGTVLSGFYYFVIYYLHVLRAKQSSDLELAILKQDKLQASLSSLKEQLSPHFLFNTLNTLATLSNEQPVRQYVYELAGVYRYLLQYKDTDAAPLQQELDFIQSYLYIIKTRFEDAIVIDIRVSPSLAQSRIPPLTLQLLLENAIKHNVAARYKPLHISIYDDGREIVVTNNLQPRQSVSYTTGTGLDNISRRYHLLFGREIGIENGPDHFTVKLPVIL